jgi:hypothetical protein
MVVGYDDKFLNNRNKVLVDFPILNWDFAYPCDMGGSEVFRVFLFRKYSNRKYSKRWDCATDCVVGVLDKKALLESLQQLPSQGGQKWEKVLNKVAAEAKQGGWRKLDFSEEPMLWVEPQIQCYILKWATRKHPRWNSLQLHALLCRWARGSRKIGMKKGANNNSRTKVIISPILLGDEMA